MDVLDATYTNTGGNCYVLFGEVYANIGGVMDVIYFAGSVDCEETPRIDFYASRESAEACDIESGDYLMTAYIEDGDWVAEIWRKAFCYFIGHDKGHHWDAYVACVDYEKLCKNYQMW